MNSITLHGKLNKDASSALVNNNGKETPIVAFSMTDFGLPYAKNEPMSIEVNFMREPAMTICDFLKKGKEVIVTGCLRSKKFTLPSGAEKTKYYISADYVIMTGMPRRKEVVKNDGAD